MVSLENQVYGTMLVVSAAMTFALVALVVKQDPLPTVLATEARFFVSWVMSVAFMLRYRSEQGLNWFGPPQLRWGLVLRGVLLYSFVMLWWSALTMAPLGDCIAVIYCDPLLTVLLSALFLGEKRLAVFPLQALLAITGMCCIVQPPALLALLGLPPAETVGGGGNYTLVVAAMCVSGVMPIVTNQTKEASWIEVEHVTNFLTVFILNPVVYCVQQFAKDEPVWAMPAVDAWGVGLIVLAALGSFVGVAMQTRGYQLADPGKAAMFTYMEIPFGYLLQQFGTRSQIEMHSVLGAFLVILACLLGAVALQSSSKEIADEKIADETTSLRINLPKTVTEP